LTPQFSPLQLGGYFSFVVFLAIIIAVLVAVFLYFLFWALSKKPVTGVESLRGKVGVALRDFGKGTAEVSVEGVIWKAQIAGGGAEKISKGDQVVVVGVSELVLLVQKKV
jgi:membrane protein implicated in regulation of membrane protease activity